jgi:hypothetical protein
MLKTILIFKVIKAENFNPSSIPEQEVTQKALDH